MNGLSASAVQEVWIYGLVVFVVVLVAVATLLTLVHRTVKSIHGGVSEIWNVGRKIANNTIHIALLDRTNFVAGRILRSATGVVGATAALTSHAESCPHCPRCALGGSP